MERVLPCNYTSSFCKSNGRRLACCSHVSLVYVYVVTCFILFSRKASLPTLLGNALTEPLLRCFWLGLSHPSFDAVKVSEPVDVTSLLV
jgi:hypothetical protein